MDPVFYLRFLERLLAVAISGVSIYLGYRLFLDVPKHKDSSGTLHLPWSISIVMTRVGPGAFFALFGAVAICLALFLPLRTEESTGASGDGEPASKQGPVAQTAPVAVVSRTEASYAGGQSLTDEERANRKLVREKLADPISALNSVPSLLKPDLAESLRKDVLRDLAETKILLMQPAWGSPDEGFGDINAFRQWALDKGEKPQPPPGMEGALQLYRSGQRVPPPVGRRPPPEGRP